MSLSGSRQQAPQWLHSPTRSNAYAAIVTVNDETATAAPDEMATEFRFKLAPDVPTEPSMMTVVPSLLSRRNHVAVPAAFALESDVMAFAAAEPEDAPAKAVAFMVNSARRTCAPIAVSASVGWVPS